MFKKFSIICITLFLFFCTCFPVFATSLDAYKIYNTKYSRPAATEHNGYLEVLVRNKNTGTIYSRIYFWSIQHNSESKIDPYVRIKENGDSLDLTPIADSGSYWSLFVIKPLNDTLDLVASGPTNSSIAISVDDGSSSLEVFSFRAYGNYLFYGTDGTVDTETPFIINYGNDINVTFEAMLQELRDIDLKIGTIANILENHGMTFELIASFLLDIGLTLDEILEILKENEDSTVTDESGEVNDDLTDVTDDIGEIEDTVVDDFTENIGNLPDFDFNGLTDFSTTAFWVSTQIQNIYDSSDKIRFIFTAALSFGVALMIIGRGTRL